MGSGESTPTYSYNVYTDIENKDITIKAIHDATWENSSLGSSQAPYDMNDTIFRRQYNRWAGDQNGLTQNEDQVSLDVFRGRRLYAWIEPFSIWPNSN